MQKNLTNNQKDDITLRKLLDWQVKLNIIWRADNNERNEMVELGKMSSSIVKHVACIELELGSHTISSNRLEPHNTHNPGHFALQEMTQFIQPLPDVLEIELPSMLADY